MKRILLLILSLLLISGTVLAQKNKKTTKKSGAAPAKTSTAKTTAEKKSEPAVSKNESEILSELNSLRTNPQNYIKYLEEMKQSFSGNKFKNSQGLEVVSFEGVAAVDEAIEFLKKQTPMSGLKISKGLTKAANQHLQDMLTNDFFGHRGTDQSLPDERAGIFGSAKSGVTENITEGGQTAKEIVLQMIISDGLKSRSQRNNL